MKPGSCGPGVLGVYPVIYDENGDEVPQGSGKAGNICIRNPWPGIFQTVWGDPDRFLSTYFRKYNKNPDSRTGATGRTSPMTVPSSRPTGTTASSAGSTT